MSRTKHHRKSMYNQNPGVAKFKKILTKNRKKIEHQLIQNKDYETAPTQKKSLFYDYY